MMEVVSGGNLSCKTCIAPVKSSPPTNHVIIIIIIITTSAKEVMFSSALVS